ncbi:hypothetical protein BJX99DRAFT_262950 [Aspergillus californicus]
MRDSKSATRHILAPIITSIRPISKHLTQTRTVPRTIHLAIFSNGARPAHVAIFIPTGNTGPKGKVIHVTGNTAVGFFLEFKRNYDFSTEERRYKTIPLDEVEDRYIVEVVGNGEPSSDTTARDQLEAIALIVPPPGRSPKPFDPSARNCQDWMRDYVDKLVEEGIVGDAARLVVESAPKVF